MSKQVDEQASEQTTEILRMRGRCPLGSNEHTERAREREKKRRIFENNGYKSHTNAVTVINPRERETEFKNKALSKYPQEIEENEQYSCETGMTNTRTHRS